MNITERVSNPVKCRVHLHIHLEGSMRPSTLWDLRRQKNLPLPANGALRDLEEALQINSPRDLAYCLEKFQWLLPALEGDLAAIERIAYEFVEDEARQSVLYTEPRFSPHLLVGSGDDVTARQVTEAVLRGLRRGEQQFGVTARLLLCCIRGMTDYMETLEICTEYRDRGVVGIDMCGDEALAVQPGGDAASCIKNSDAELEVFQEAARRGIHRTVHAGEAGPAYMVQVALDEMLAERIGHGYSVLEDEELYKRCIRDGVHFECCPSSSYHAGLVPLTQTKHPIQRFCEDGANFSANLDDTAIFQYTYEDEISLLRRMGFTEANFAAMVREYVDPRQRPVFAYKGIPYATPPVGRLRFKPPVRDYGWNRTQRFDRFGPECPQLDVQGVPEPGVSEDCLTLNVWIPQIPDGFQRFPVVVFLDGELFWRQRSSRYPLEELSSEDIVTVSISYRTNMFGFFTLQSSAAPGNLGLRDQQLALLWVRENIGAFGGDSRRVTLVGFSAGAASVGLHLVSPQSQGLFQRAMLVSGSPLATWAHMSAREARGIGEELAAIMGCRSGSDSDMVRCLQDQDFMRLLTAAQRILESRGRFHPVFAPVTDSFVATRDQFLPEDPDRLLRRGEFIKVPVMSGVDADDGILMLYQYPGTDRLTFSNLTDVLRRVVIPRLLDQRGFTRRRNLLTGVLGYRYVDTVPTGSQQLMLASFVKIFSDAYFVSPLYSFLDLYARSGADLYAYSYTGEGPDIFGNTISLPGASHGSELLYVLGPTMHRTMVGGTYGPVQQRLGQKLRAYWTGFIVEGDPVRGRYGERWDRYTLDQPVFQDLVSSVSVVGYRREDASYWNRFLGFIADEGGTDPTESATNAPLVGSEPPYETVMWVLLAVLILLLIGLLVAFILTRRRRRLKSDMAYG